MGSIPIQKVPIWSVYGGIGHVVMSRDVLAFLGTRWACGVVGNMRGFQAERPKRICRKCREALERGDLVWAKEGGE